MCPPSWRSYLRSLVRDSIWTSSPGGRTACSSRSRTAKSSQTRSYLSTSNITTWTRSSGNSICMTSTRSRGASMRSSSAIHSSRWTAQIFFPRSSARPTKTTFNLHPLQTAGALAWSLTRPRHSIKSQSSSRSKREKQKQTTRPKASNLWNNAPAKTTVFSVRVASSSPSVVLITPRWMGQSHHRFALRPISEQVTNQWQTPRATTFSSSLSREASSHSAWPNLMTISSSCNWALPTTPSSNRSMDSLIRTRPCSSIKISNTSKT